VKELGRFWVFGKLTSSGKIKLFVIVESTTGLNCQRTSGGLKMIKSRSHYENWIEGRKRRERGKKVCLDFLGNYKERFGG